MKFTTEKPTTNGWYWIRMQSFENPPVYAITRYHNGEITDYDSDCEVWISVEEAEHWQDITHWAGPISRPEDP